MELHSIGVFVEPGTGLRLDGSGILLPVGWVGGLATGSTSYHAFAGSEAWGRGWQTRSANNEVALEAGPHDHVDTPVCSSLVGFVVFNRKCTYKAWRRCRPCQHC